MKWFLILSVALIGCADSEIAADVETNSRRPLSVDGDNVFGIEDTAMLTDPAERLPCELLHRWPQSLPAIAAHPELARGYEFCIAEIVDSLHVRIVRQDDPLAKSAWERICPQTDGAVGEMFTGQTFNLLMDSPASVSEWIVDRASQGDSCLITNIGWGAGYLSEGETGKALATLRSVETDAQATSAQRRAARVLRRVIYQSSRTDR